MFVQCSSETTVQKFVCEMRVCNLYIHICVHLSVRESLTRLIIMYGLAYKPLSHWCLINSFFICMINSAFLILFESKNSFVFCTC